MNILKGEKDMPNWILYAAAIIILLHGLIHLMGTAAYWQLADITELPYKTTLLGNRWDVGTAGIRVFGLLWLVAAAGFALAVYGLVTGQAWYYPLMIAVALLSMVISALDWEVAFRGTIIDVVILIALVALPRVGLLNS